MKKVHATSCEVIYIHAGHLDVWSGKDTKDTEDIVKSFRGFLDSVLDRTNAKICVSLVIPGIKYYPKFSKGVESLNQLLANLVTEMRKNRRQRDRIFTENNNRLQSFISRTVGPHGVKMQLSDRGEKTLWLNTKRAIGRTIGAENRDYSGERQSYRRYPRSNSRYNDER